MKSTGITLIELIVTLAVVSVLLAMGIPQFKSSTSNSRLTSAINTLTGDFAFARSEAIKRALPVSVTAENVSNWATSGWITAVNISGVSTKLRVSPPLSVQSSIAADVTSVRFNPDGQINSVAVLSFTLCDDRSGTYGKKVTLNSSGQNFLETKQTCNP